MANQPSKYSKFLVGAASAALVASAVAPVASAADFKDSKGTHEEAINALSDAGVISGYPDGTFLPNKTLSRSDVVKLMGKWLVAEGSVVPTDYKTNPRFSDLTSTSNDELLKFAAVVKDNGVFVGTPDGKLDPTGNITRENMAVVLVRAFDRVHEIDLTTYVAGQDFKKDVTDLGKAKAEARPAIEVLDFFDITNPAAPAFNPKSTTTRGQFATFLYKTTKTDFSKVTTGVVGSADIKAVNATTVEVTFKDTVENFNSLDFKIDGLTVSNAAVKQSNDKVVVLTTAVQKGGEKYTVTLNEKAIGSFSGVSDVVPTKIDITTQSVQGKVGAQAILSADVGVKQAGIPVTFNVKANTTGTLNKDQVFESVTNADGIATFSYTQYSAGTDSVVAYPTGAPTVRSLGYVFWGVDTILNVEEVTIGETINNGANKTYKVTYKDAATGKVEANKTFNVSVLENIDVTADKLQNVKVEGKDVKQLSNNTSTITAQIKTDAKGEATFTVSGTNAEATPVVFEAVPQFAANGSLVQYSSKYVASSLQAKASKVKFAATQAAYILEVTRDGQEIAATGETNGRVYKVLVKDKAGNVAKNETVNVAFNEDLDRVISSNTASGFVNTDTKAFYPNSTPTAGANVKSQISVKTDAKGEATFTIASDKVNDYATPITWIDINTSDAKQGKLDESEPQALGQISHFQAAYLDGAKLVGQKNGAGDATDKFEVSEKAVFSAELTNQSGKKFASTDYTIDRVTYTVFNTGSEDVKVGDVVISPNRSETFPTGVNGKLAVGASKAGSVRVVATGEARHNTTNVVFSFTAKEATATFTNVKSVTAPFTGYVTDFNPVDTGSNTNSLWFADKDPIKYTGTNVKYFGANGNEIFGEAAWEAYLTSLIGSDVLVSYSKDGDNTIFKVISAVVPVTADGNELGLSGGPAVITNAAPVAKTVTPKTVEEGSTFDLTVSDLATDSDLADVLTITAVAGSSTNATATISTDKTKITFTGVTEHAASASTTYNVVVSDGTDSIVVPVIVTVANTVAPVVTLSDVTVAGKTVTVDFGEKVGFMSGSPAVFTELAATDPAYAGMFTVTNLAGATLTGAAVENVSYANGKVKLDLNAIAEGYLTTSGMINVVFNNPAALLLTDADGNAVATTITATLLKDASGIRVIQVQ